MGPGVAWTRNWTGDTTCRLMTGSLELRTDCVLVLGPTRYWRMLPRRHPITPYTPAILRNPKSIQRLIDRAATVHACRGPGHRGARELGMPTNPC